MRSLFLALVGMVGGLTFSLCFVDCRTLGIVLLILAGFCLAMLGEFSERIVK